MDRTSRDALPSGVFILGTDTEVGKTFQAALLAKYLVSQGTSVGVYKPAASGQAPSGQSDAERLRAAAGLDCPIECVCPQSFLAPLAPPVAAAQEGKVVDEQLLSEGATWWSGRCEFLIVEGAGGALSPISSSMTVLDLATSLKFPIVLIAANRLGVVNHTLLTLEAVRNRQLEIQGIVLNTLPASEGASSTADFSLQTNRELLQQFITDLPVVESIVDFA